MKQQYFGLPLAAVLALTAALFSGVNNFITKIAVTAINDPILYTGVKNGLVAIVLASVFILLARRTELKSLKQRDWLMLGAIGLVGGAIPFALFFTGLSMTSAVSASLIHKTLVLWIALLAYPFLKERFTPLIALGVALVFLGNIFIGGFNSLHFGTGEYLVLAATMLWAIENIIAKKALAHISILTVVSARMVIGSLALFAFLSLSGRVAPVATLSALQWGWTILSAVLLLGYVVSWYSALAKAPATLVAALLLPATLITSSLSAVFVTHTLTGIQALSGGAIILGGIVLVRELGKKLKSATGPRANALHGSPS